jgi:hypothetical protein
MSEGSVYFTAAQATVRLLGPPDETPPELLHAKYEQAWLSLMHEAERRSASLDEGDIRIMVLVKYKEGVRGEW